MGLEIHDKNSFLLVSYMSSYNRTKNGVGHSSRLLAISSQSYEDISHDT